MADPISLTSHIISQAVARGLEILKAIYSREKSRRIAITLETTEEKFLVWRQTWMKNVLDPGVTSEILWGKAGWADVQRLLQSASEAARMIENASFQIASRNVRSGWKLGLLSQPKRKKQQRAMETSNLQDLAFDLSKFVDVLCAYSQYVFDSLHGLLTNKGQTPIRDQLVADSVHSRSISLALYRRCYNLGLDCSLNVDLFGVRPDAQALLVRRTSVSSIRSSKLSYHLLTQARDARADMYEITTESFTGVSPKNHNSRKAPGTNSTELYAFESKPSSKLDLDRLKTQTTGEEALLRIVRLPTIITAAPETETFAQILEEGRHSAPTEVVLPLTHETRVELAFKLAECGFYLLGTPWLASLDCKRLRRVRTDSQQSSFVLDVHTLDLENFNHEDGQTLAEPSQLLSIGVILMEIALNTHDHTNSGDPYLKTSEMLPRVEQSMGSQYCKATAFCLQDRPYTKRFSQPDKYQDPEGTGWNDFLQDLLEDYYVQVFSR